MSAPLRLSFSKPQGMNANEAKGHKQMTAFHMAWVAVSQCLAHTPATVYTLVGSSLNWSGPRDGRGTERHYPGEP